MSEEMSSLPIIALVNSKSGGQDGPKLIRKICKYLPAESVYDLAQGGPAIGLAKCKERRTRVLVCGGDGTVAWVLSEIKKLQLPERIRPVVATLPLGTANDLSRTLKWGPGWAGESIKPLFANMEKASVVFMDQWRVTASSAENGDAQEKVHIMNNYFSVGSDALIALKFHNHREKKPHLFTNRTRNKGWYVKYAIDTFLRARPIAESVEVELDGIKIPLSTSLSMVLAINLPSYASGNNPWGKTTKSKKGKNYVRPAIDDGMFELVGIKGIVHAGTIQTGLMRAKRLGQGRHLSLALKKPIAAQVDGEPWLQQPATIKISHEGTAMVLANSPPVEHSVPAVSLTAAKTPTLQASSSSAITHTKSPIHYGPVESNKRKDNRYYCDDCGLEFFLKYMLENHRSSCGQTTSAPPSQSDFSLSPPLSPVDTSSSDVPAANIDSVGNGAATDANGGDDDTQKARCIDDSAPSVGDALFVSLSRVVLA